MRLVMERFGPLGGRTNIPGVGRVLAGQPFECDDELGRRLLETHARDFKVEGEKPKPVATDPVKVDENEAKPRRRPKRFGPKKQVTDYPDK